MEVGPRDGLQNESKIVPLETKVKFIRMLMQSGLKSIELTSFVHPKVVPQLGDADDVAKTFAKESGVNFFALVPNERGLERAIQSGIQNIAVFTAASNTFVQKNINMTLDESLKRFSEIIKEAKAKKLGVRGYVSTAFVCPFEGTVQKEKVLDVTQALLDMGADQVSLGDTIGAAAPTDIESTIGFILKKVTAEKIALHLHDTYGAALANAYAALQLGVKTFDTSAGGLGGCPFAPGAAGNLATEDLLYMLHRMGHKTGIDFNAVVSATKLMANALQRKLPPRPWNH